MSSANPDQASLRKQLRQRLIAARQLLDPAEHQRLNVALGSHVLHLLQRLQPSTLGFCWPFRSEPDLTQLISDWLADDPTRRAALPVVMADERVLQFRQWQPGATLSADCYGIPAPASGAWLSPQVLLIPVNGFDTRGYRLGYGGGYFDRTLAALDASPGSAPVVAVGVGFEMARIEDLPQHAHDRPMDWIVTELGWVVTPGR